MDLKTHPKTFECLRWFKDVTRGWEGRRREDVGRWLTQKKALLRALWAPPHQRPVSGEQACACLFPPSPVRKHPWNIVNRTKRFVWTELLSSGAPYSTTLPRGELEEGCSCLNKGSWWSLQKDPLENLKLGDREHCRLAHPWKHQSSLWTGVWLPFTKPRVRRAARMLCWQHSGAASRLGFCGARERSFTKPAQAFWKASVRGKENPEPVNTEAGHSGVCWKFHSGAGEDRPTREKKNVSGDGEDKGAVLWMYPLFPLIDLLLP